MFTANKFKWLNCTLLLLVKVVAAAADEFHHYCDIIQLLLYQYQEQYNNHYNGEISGSDIVSAHAMAHNEKVDSLNDRQTDRW